MTLDLERLEASARSITATMACTAGQPDAMLVDGGHVVVCPYHSAKRMQEHITALVACVRGLEAMFTAEDGDCDHCVAPLDNGDGKSVLHAGCYEHMSKGMNQLVENEERFLAAAGEQAKRIASLEAALRLSACAKCGRSTAKHHETECDSPWHEGFIGLAHAESARAIETKEGGS